MTKSELNNEYFNWMYQLVCDERYVNSLSYRYLFSYLHHIDFTYSISMDGNRSEDGMDLRYRFGYEKSYESPMITAFLDDRPCSVLEMMVALSIRCEEIMADQDAGNRVGQWFWSMILNLGLDSMNDFNFDETYTNNVITNFLERRYEPNGKGGLFTVKHCRYDLRSVEIWYQMCWYLDEILQ